MNHIYMVEAEEQQAIVISRLRPAGRGPELGYGDGFPYRTQPGGEVAEAVSAEEGAGQGRSANAG